MDWCAGTIGRSAATRTVAVLTLLVCLLGASRARGVVVRMRDGQMIGISPRAGVASATLPGALTSTAQPRLADNGDVDYQGGPVLHSSAPYLIFWDPSSAIPTTTEALMERYFTDVAHDSGLATNIYGVLRQYSDRTGIADYEQAFSPDQVIHDGDAYPPLDSANCLDADPSHYPICLTDAQLQAELSHLIGVDGLPTDGSTSAGELVSDAPIYFIVTPADVDICDDGECADSLFCSYHSDYPDGASQVLYAAIPLLMAENPAANPKECQADNNAAVQEPNGDRGDVALKYIGHEDSETITDPLVGTGWYDSISGNEVADNCNYWNGGRTDTATGDNPNAFEPTLGGSAAAGTLYDQLIDGDEYYLQSDWSNGDVDCEMRPTTATLIPSFTAPAGAAAVGSSVAFDPTASLSTGGYSAVEWSFGDGAGSFTSSATTSNPAPVPVSHAYAAPGTYTVTLTLLDTHGNLATETHVVTVAETPSAAFTASTVHPLLGATVAFDGSGSSDPNAGGAISSYSWSFGDGATGTGATPSHTFTAAGTNTVTLTVTDSLGLSASVTQQIEVVTPPVAAFTFSPRVAVPGHPVAFDGGSSSDPNPGGSISSYSWSFGDKGTAAGATPSHTYRAPGIYMVRLSVAEGFGAVTEVTHLVYVTSPGAPTSSSGSLSGVAKARPKLTFEVFAGLNAPGCHEIVVGLPGGLVFAARGLARGLRVSSADGQRPPFAATVSASKLTITLKGAAGAVNVTIKGPAIAAQRTLERRVRQGKVNTLSVAVTAIDSAGTRTGLPLALSV